MTDLEGLSNDLAKAHRSNLSHCKACLWLAEEAPQDIRDTVATHLRAGIIGPDKLAAIFADHGVPIARHSIRTHRAHLRREAAS